jgi:excisionase family DNA binding protein
MQPTILTFEPLISAAEAGQLLGIHPVTILRWARDGRIPHCRLGRKVKFRVSELTAWSTTSTLIVPFVSPNPKGEGTWT